MSAALVRKGLEISAGDKEVSDRSNLKALKNSGKRRLKLIEKRKKSKLSEEQLLKQNLKILKALEFSSTAKKYGKISAPLPPKKLSKKSSDKGTIVVPKEEEIDPDLPRRLRRKLKQEKKTRDATNASVFTEEDFEKFEREYFVTD